MRLFSILTAMIMTAQLTYANQDQNYDSLHHLFVNATEPNMNRIKEGWYSGRCISQREPNTIKSGVLVFKSTRDKDGVQGFKQIIPASSIRSEKDFFDIIDDTEYEVYREELYEKNNQSAQIINASLTSDLYYGILIGSLFTRELNDFWIITLTNYQADPLTKGESFFYCLINKEKVREY